MSQFFARFANRVATVAGHYLTFIVALGIVLVWAMVGPWFDFSDTWQLAVNTGTTIATFLMVFLIQNTQNRDSIATHVKLDEIIRAMSQADDALIDSEEATDRELDALRARYRRLAEEHKALKDKLSEIAPEGY